MSFSGHGRKDNEFPAGSHLIVSLKFKVTHAISYVSKRGGNFSHKVYKYTCTYLYIHIQIRNPCVLHCIVTTPLRHLGEKEIAVVY